MKGLPIEVWRLTIAYSLMMAGTSMMVLLAGIIGTGFAPRESLATLPIALVVVGVAASTLPTGRLLQRFGRRRVFLAYGLLAIVAALLAAASLVIDSFFGFCAAAALMGWAGAAGHQYRFAALEAVPAHDSARPPHSCCWAASWPRSSVPNSQCGAGRCLTCSSRAPSCC